MKAWNIYHNGEPYSMVYTGRGVTPTDAIAQWYQQQRFSNPGVWLPDNVEARPYIRSALDQYGN